MSVNIDDEKNMPRYVIYNGEVGAYLHTDNSQLLEKGKKYLMVGMDILDWHTHVYLAEYPSKQFNSVNFDEDGSL
jgi:hypothetical protein